MKDLAVVWWRAFSIVTCTSLNVTQVAARHYGTAFFTGGLLSFIWWQNTRTANRTEGRAAQLAYAFGAACGTLFGVLIGDLLNGW